MSSILFNASCVMTPLRPLPQMSLDAFIAWYQSSESDDFVTTSQDDYKLLYDIYIKNHAIEVADYREQLAIAQIGTKTYFGSDLVNLLEAYGFDLITAEQLVDRTAYCPIKMIDLDVYEARRTAEFNSIDSFITYLETIDTQLYDVTIAHSVDGLTAIRARAFELRENTATTTANTI